MNDLLKQIQMTEMVKKCALCGNVGKGLCLQSRRYENLPSVFICDGCLDAVSEKRKKNSLLKKSQRKKREETAK